MTRFIQALRWRRRQPVHPVYNEGRAVYVQQEGQEVGVVEVGFVERVCGLQEYARRHRRRYGGIC